MSAVSETLPCNACGQDLLASSPFARCPGCSREAGKTIDLSALDQSSGAVLRDRPCTVCGYNLRTMHWNSACPECSQIVALSLRIPSILIADAEWLRRIRQGIWCLLFCMVAWLGYGNLGIVRGPVDVLGSFSLYALAVASSLPLLLISALALRLPDAVRAEWDRQRTNRMLVYCVPVGIIAAGILAGLTLRRVVSPVAEIPAYATMIVGVTGMFLVIRNVAMRAHAPRVAGLWRLVAWLWGVAAGIQVLARTPAEAWYKSGFDEYMLSLGDWPPSPLRLEPTWVTACNSVSLLAEWGWKLSLILGIAGCVLTLLKLRMVRSTQVRVPSEIEGLDT